MNVGIIGAGVSGLATAKVLLSHGHQVTMFEKVDSLGGVWSPARRYPGLQLQTIRDCYAFSDFPMPRRYPEFPRGQDVHEYLTAYAAHFGLLPRIRLGCEVVRIEPRSDGTAGWRLWSRDRGGPERSDDFDFVVVCNGIFSEPSVPQFPGRATFEANGGIVLHSSEVGDAAKLKDRDVAVVGFGKSALDLAEASLSIARSTAIVYRRVPWKLPHRIWGRLHVKYFMISRFTELWYPNPNAGRFRKFLHNWLKPLVNAYWAISGHIIRRQLGMDSDALRPEGSLGAATPCVTLALDNLKSIRTGRIAAHRAGISGFTPDGIALDNGETLKAQAVVLATGFQQNFQFLGAAERGKLFDPSGSMQLYRLLINPDIPDMAFNGFNGVGACQLIAEVGAVWLASVLDGRVRLPDRDVMFASIRQEIDLRRKVHPQRHDAGSYSTPASMAYLDRLLADIGQPPADRHRRAFDWLFTPLNPADYKDALAQGQSREPS